MKKTTMQDIADKLGISKSLVSIALNNRYGVSDDMRFKIYLTAIELGFDFNYKYRTREEKERQSTIMVLIKRNILIDTGYWNDVLSGAEKILDVNNYILDLEVWDEQSTPTSILMKIQERSVDGILVIDALPKGTISLLSKMNIPILFVDGKEYTDKLFDSIRVNNYLGGYLVAEYLISMGHKKIAFVGDKDFAVSFRERYFGFKNYIDENGKVKFHGTINQSTYDIIDNPIEESNITKVLKKEDRPTALFCANDAIAMFVYKEVQKLGLSIPDDISIVGFDNLKEASLLKPKLTSINVLKKELGKIAVEQLLYKIRFRNAPMKTTLISVNLDIKNSVKKI